MIISVILMFSLRYATDEWDWLNCAEVAGGGSVCFGISSVFRASFVLFVYHIIIILVIFPAVACSAFIHDSVWGFKNLIIAALFIGSFWINFKFYTTWAWICLVMSCFFLLIQGYFLLNLAYTWNEALLNAVNNDARGGYALFLLILYSILTGSGCMIWIVYQFIWFGHCGIAKFVLVVTILFVVAFYVCSVVRLCNVEIFREEANIFVSSLVSIYVCYLSWAALSSNPDETCNPFTESPVNSLWNIIGGTIFTMITILSIATAFNTGGDNKKSALHA